MKIKRYVAPDIRQAIRMVREKQGPDAVILSNRRVEGGIELIAAVDYDENANKAGESQFQELQKFLSPQDKNAMQTAVTKAYQPQTEVDYPYQAEPVSPRVLLPVTPNHVDSGEALQQVQKEIKTLRDLLENQLSGLAWSAMKLRRPIRASLLKKLMNMGLGADICRRVVNEVDSGLAEDKAWYGVLDVLAKRMVIGTEKGFKHGGVFAFFGATGVGKTTTIAKIASRFALQKDPRKVLLITTDNYRIGGKEQLKVYSRILGIPLQVINDQLELEEVIKNVAPEQLVLIDTPGIQSRLELPQQKFSFLLNASFKIKKFLVLSATAQRSDLEHVVSTFSDLHINGSIITKVDECTSLGGVISVAVNNRLPVVYISEGQRVPEDLQHAVASKLISKGVMLSQQGDVALEDDELALEFGETSDDASVQ